MCQYWKTFRKCVCVISEIWGWWYYNIYFVCVCENGDTFAPKAWQIHPLRSTASVLPANLCSVWVIASRDNWDLLSGTVCPAGLKMLHNPWTPIFSDL